MAEQWLAGVEADLMRGSWTVPNPPSESVAIWATRWMASKLNLKPGTKADYEMAMLGSENNRIRGSALCVSSDDGSTAGEIAPGSGANRFNLSYRAVNPRLQPWR